MNKRFLFTLGLSALATGIATETALRKKDKPLQAYGQKVRVFGKYISTEIIGNGDHVIVLYPGTYEVSPILSYRPLAKQLAKYFTVITYEPFGYGDSDSTNHTRSLENMSEELHQTMKALGYSHYSLGLHSSGGVVGMALAIKYPEEIESCLLIDTTPVEITNYTSAVILEKASGYALKGLNHIGITRLLSKTNKLMPVVNGYTYTKQERNQYLQCALNNGFSKNKEEELNELDLNLRSMVGQKYPASIPVCSFVSTNTDKLLTKFGAPSEAWINAHKTLSDNPSSNFYTIDGSHYLQHSEPEMIARMYTNWFKDII